MVLQIIDLLYIKYESQKFIVMYISNHWMETTRERVCQYYWRKVGDVLYICTLQKTNPEEYMAPESSNRKFDYKIYSKGSKKRCSKNNKISGLEVQLKTIRFPSLPIGSLL